MKVEIEYEIQPFKVPSYVICKPKPGLKQDGLVETPKLELSQLSKTDLLKMCEEFTREVMKKAGKKYLSRKTVE